MRCVPICVIWVCVWVGNFWLGLRCLGQEAVVKVYGVATVI